MNLLVAFFAFIFTSSCFIFGSLGAEQNNSSSTEAYRPSFITIVERANEYLNANGFPALQINSGSVRIYSEFNESYQKNTIHFGGKYSRQIDIELDSDSMSLLGFQRLGITHAEKFDSPVKPQWTKEQALEKALAFLKTVAGTGAMKLGSPVVWYTVGRDYPKYIEGEWSVGWPRIDKEDHIFADDGAKVIMSEKMGPVALGYNLYSKFDEINFKPITVEAALAKAASYAKQMFVCAALRDWYRDYKIDDTAMPSSKLLIVNPNHLENRSSIEDAVMNHDIHARLAWVITYKTIYVGNAGEPGTKLANGFVQVWIDAENRDLLGGNSK